MRIAVTSQNFKTVTNHAGKARRFIIFEAVFPKDPVEVDRLDLPKEMSFHEFAGGPHPLDGVDALISGSAGDGLVTKLSRRRIQLVATSETDPLQAVRDFLAGTIKPAAPHQHASRGHGTAGREHRPGHDMGPGGGMVGGRGGRFRFGPELGVNPPHTTEEGMEAVMVARSGEERMQRHRHDRDVFHAMLRYHHQLKREVENLANGIRSVTISEDPEVVKLLHDHAPSMHHRLQENFGLRFWDTAFVEIFAQRDKVRMEVTLLPNGVLVEETSDDPNVVKLIQAHGQVVNAFVREGFAAAQQVSPLPADYRRAAS